MNGKQNLRLVVRTREAVVFDGEVESVSSKNEMGVFDVLERHANFISLVGEVLMVRESGGGEREIEVDNGVLRVRENVVEVYLGIKKGMNEE